MVLELNVARLKGSLDGDTPEARFQDFVRRQREAEFALAILREYPVLARQLVICLDQWVAATLEFVERLCEDWRLIVDAFSPTADPGVLVRVEADAGDRHREGRSVLVATFTSGFQVIYKPKSLAVDSHFQDLLAWVNQRAGRCGLRTIRILDRGTHGWVEFVGAEPCDSHAALRRFYERLGMQLALLYVLEATDFHCENLIAAGEHPVLIDLEAIFQPRCIGPRPESEAGDRATIEQSVLRVGMLPQRDWPTAESEGVDISGMGGAAGQTMPYRVPDWEKSGTDEMCLTRRRVEMPSANNRPSLESADVNPADYVDEIVAGFSHAYRLVMEHREELLASDGPLARFAEDEVRAILRPSRPYGILLDESFHPDVLRDALDRDRLFDRLWVAAERFPYMAKVIAAERLDLQRGDIPIFMSRPGSRDLWTSSGQRIKDFFPEPALTLVEHRVRLLCESEAEVQRWIIRASLATIAPAASVSGQRSVHRADGSRGPVQRHECLEAARTVADRLEALAIRANGSASWFGLMLENERHWSVAPLTIDLYDGLPGVCLFLAHLAAITREPRYTALAREACATMLRHSAECSSLVTSIGVFEGWGGIIYTLAHLRALWRAPELLAQAEGVVERLPTWIARDTRFDTIGGAAGCIAGLIALQQMLPSARTLSAATQCGEHLLAHAARTEHGVGWIIPNETAPLSGFSHGAAGIARALLKLATLTGQESFRTTALAAIAHERSLFSPQAGNWRDLRVRATGDSGSQGDGEGFTTAWCNGAPGIGLARLSTIEELDDPEVRGEIDAAVHTTLQRGLGGNHTLCHGDLGNLELLLVAGRVFENESWFTEARRVARPIVESIGRHEYRCAAPLNVDSPGLMTGLAGIGYGLLRLAEPLRVPSILTLDPPCQD
jgi:type 2 lantibiotic biosynthesis protein LanM